MVPGQNPYAVRPGKLLSGAGGARGEAMIVGTRGIGQIAVVALVLIAVVAPLLADAAAPARQELEQALEQSRELIKSGEYDKSIDLCVATLPHARAHTDALRQTYLQLIASHVYLGTYLLRQPQGRSSADLNYRRAKELIAECVSQKELRGTRPEPEIDFPPEMIQRFQEVRSEILGGFRVTKLSPVNAVVQLDGDTLKSSDESGQLEAVDILVGPHEVAVHAAGHVPVRDTIEIAPGVVLEQPYLLRRRRGVLWYATRAGGVGGLAALLILASKPKPVADLPGPPPPPSAAGH